MGNNISRKTYKRQDPIKEYSISNKILVNSASYRNHVKPSNRFAMEDKQINQLKVIR